MALFPPLPQLSDEDDDAVVFPPVSPPVVQWGERVAWRQLRHEAAPTAPPSTAPPPGLLAQVAVCVCVCVCVGTWCSFTFPRSQWATGQAHTWLVYITGGISPLRDYSTSSRGRVGIKRSYCVGACVVYEKLVDFSPSLNVRIKTTVWCGVLHIILLVCNLTLSSSCFMTPSWLLLTWNIFSHSPEHTNTERWACVYSCCPRSSKFFFFFVASFREIDIHFI
jgi:hypothetical protein